MLNPGKMRAWEEQAASTEASDPRGAFAAAYRLADASAPPAARRRRVGGGAGVVVAAAAPAARATGRSGRRGLCGADLSEAVAVLPLGAIEAHGPHLPLGVDAMHNEPALARALRRLPATR